jgi:hypothetical protein
MCVNERVVGADSYRVGMKVITLDSGAARHVKPGVSTRKHGGSRSRLVAGFLVGARPELVVINPAAER